MLESMLGSESLDDGDADAAAESASWSLEEVIKRARMKHSSGESDTVPDQRYHFFKCVSFWFCFLLFCFVCHLTTDVWQPTMHRRRGGADAVKKDSHEEPATGAKEGEGWMVSDVRSSRNTSDIGHLGDLCRTHSEMNGEAFKLASCVGYNLPPNIREGLKYRIRRKRSLSGIVKQLASHYQKLSTNLTGDDFGDLLPHALEDQELRRAKIRELLEEVRGKSGTKVFSGREEEVLVAASAVSKKWDTQGLSL